MYFYSYGNGHSKDMRRLRGHTYLCLMTKFGASRPRYESQVEHDSIVASLLDAHPIDE